MTTYMDTVSDEEVCESYSETIATSCNLRDATHYSKLSSSFTPRSCRSENPLKVYLVKIQQRRPAAILILVARTQH